MSILSKLHKFLVALLLCFPLLAFAANDSSGSPWRFGVGLGAGFINVITDAEWDIYSGYEETVDMTSKGLDISLSFDVAYDVSRYLRLHSGVGLDYRYIISNCVESYFMGVEKKDSKSCSINTMQFYLEVPLMVQLKIPGMMFFEVGPVFDVLLHSHTDSYMPPESNSYKSNPFKNRRFAASVAAGVGHEFLSGFFVDFMVSYQFTDLVDRDSKDVEWNPVVERLMTDEPVAMNEDLLPNDNRAGTYYKLIKFKLGVGFWW